MARLKKWIQRKDPKTLAFGFLLVICSAICVAALVNNGFLLKSPYLTGAILFAYFGIVMMRKSKR